jgi:voltage-dependent potassium channel beta subunit
MYNAKMPYRKLGSSGLKLSALSLGGWVTFGGLVRDRQAIQKIHTVAYEAGINFFDMADVYARGISEQMMGEALKQFPRHELVISSKVFWPMSEDINDKGLSRKHIMESLNKSLQRIGTDYLDLYFCHRFDPETPLLETIRAMDDLIHQGKILYWGTSEWTAEQLQECHKICHAGGYYAPVVEQPQYNLLVREKFETDTTRALQQFEMGAVTWSPLASGVLTGKYDNGVQSGRLATESLAWLKESILTRQNIERGLQMKKWAEQFNCTRSQLAIAWVSKQKNVSSVILGASSIEQLIENLGSLNVKLDDSVDNDLKKLFAY